jgi:hypothetical protein
VEAVVQAVLERVRQVSARQALAQVHQGQARQVPVRVLPVRAQVQAQVAESERLPSQR